jgi:HK97 gp10 family phage protein
MKSQFRIKGLDQVLKKMRMIKGEMVSTDINIAAAAGARVIEEAAIKNAKLIDDPATPEKIYENITFRVRKPRGGSGSSVVAKIGVKGGAKSGKREDSQNPGGDTRHWRHIEFGTSDVPAQPFMRRSLSENTEKATDEVVKSLSDTVDRLSK